MQEITIRQPDDWHAHLRDGDLLKAVISLFNIYGRVVCMGNLADAAPHWQTDKEKFKKAGAFNALTNLVRLGEFFKEHGAPEKFEPFVSEYGARRYDFPLNIGTITLRREAWFVPSTYRGLVPDLAGRKMEWKVVE